MKKKISVRARNCCTNGKQHLVDAIRACDDRSTGYRRHLACYRRAAKSGGRNTKSRMIF